MKSFKSELCNVHSETILQQEMEDMPYLKFIKLKEVERQ